MRRQTRGGIRYRQVSLGRGGVPVGNLRATLLLCLTLGAALLGACSGEEPALPVDFSQREDIAVREDGAQVLTYAYLPQFSHSVSFQRHNRLVRYLRLATGLNIKQVFPDTFDEHMRMVGQGKIDISFSNPFIYVKLANDYCSRAFARVVEDNGRERFRGEIIVRADNRAVQT